MFYKSLFSIKC